MSSNVSLEYFNDKIGGAGSGGSGFTAEGGFYITLINDTGANSIKGTIIEASTTDNACIVSATNSSSAMGIIYEDGVSNGNFVKVVVSGKAEVLLEDGLDSTAGYWCGVSNVAGRMFQLPAPTTAAEHNREIGHSLQSVANGTNKLSFVNLHFN